ncbi:hypothetical protein ACFFGH_31015 [Lysobacter korlensis]|uniref:Uncharacterized protein n=1 Tax=Lysobacter korlensis TaxID=553636 RepID=A0ABV6S2E4_9GAMM
MNRPQVESDRIADTARPYDVDPDSTRFLAEHGGVTFWAGRHSERRVLCLVVVEDEENGSAGCGNPPVGLGGQWGEAWLLPDGMDPRAIEGEWTTVTPNLLVQR